MVWCGKLRTLQTEVLYFQKVPGLLFGDDFAGIDDTKSALQSLTDVVHTYNYNKQWQFEAHVKKSIHMYLYSFKDRKWSEIVVWCDQSLSILHLFFHLGVELSSAGSWDKHITLLILHNCHKPGGLC